MNDFERLLRSSLQETGSSFEPKDAAAARQRFLQARRRRRITGFVSGLALAGAATAAVLFFTSSEVKPPSREDVPDIAAASDPAIVETIRVGKAPSGVTVDIDGVVWVANVDDSSVSRYQPGDQAAKSIAVPALPDDVVATDLFVFTTDHARSLDDLSGSGTVIDREGAQLAQRKNPDDIPSGNRAQYFGGALPEGPDADLGHVDMAASGGSQWVASEKEAGVSLNLDDGNGQFFDEVPPTGEITTLDGHGFALDAGAKDLYRLEPGDPGTSQTIMLPLADEVAITDAGNLDMVGGLGSIWIVQGGVLYRIDPTSGDLTATTELEGGDYAAVATGEGYVWVLEGNADDVGGGRLFKVDPDTAQVVGEALELEGRLVDVAAGGGSVWVTRRSPDALLRVSPSGAE